MSKNLQEGNYIAVVNSYGFRGKDWLIGEIAYNVQGKELSMTELNHFEFIGTETHNKKRKKNDGIGEPMHPSDLTAKRPDIIDANGDKVIIPINPNA